MAAAWASHQQPGSLARFARFSTKGEVEDLGCVKNISQYLWMLKTKGAWLRDQVAIGEERAIAMAHPQTVPPLTSAVTAHTCSHTPQMLHPVTAEPVLLQRT